MTRSYRLWLLALLVAAFVLVFPAVAMAYDFSGTGSMVVGPFDLPGGLTRYSWSYSNPDTDNLFIWLVDANTGETVGLLVNVIDASGSGSDIVFGSLPAGRYLLDVEAASSCSWALSIGPPPPPPPPPTRYTLSYSAGPGGTISGTTYQSGTSGFSGTAVTAVPNTGYHFVTWSDGITSATRTDTNVTSSLSVTATFARNVYALNYTAGAGGAISGTNPQSVEYGRSGAAVTAQRRDGYHFVSWSDGVKTATRTDANVSGDLSVMANFVANDYELQSIAGANRYGTSIAASRSTFDTGSCNAVIVATGRNYPDALAASGLAGVVRCPIILVDSAAGSVDATTKAEISRLTLGKATRTIYIIGGTGAVPAGVEASLKTGLGAVVVTRLAGPSRYDTSNAIALRARALSGGVISKALVVTGTSYHDALLAGPVAYRGKMPVLLVGTSVTTALTATIKKVGASKLEIIGSTTKVSDAVKRSLGGVVGADNVTRPCASADPYAQSVAVANWAVATHGFTWSGVGIATGDNYPDALGAGPVQGTSANPLLLTKTATATASVRNALLANVSHIIFLRYFGGTGAVTQSARDDLESVLW